MAGEQFARVMNALFGTKIRIVSGYPGGNAINLAVERGEVQGRCGWSWSGIVAERRQWIDEHKINVLVQFGLNKHPDLPDVPTILDQATTDEQKQILQLVLARQPLGRPFLAPPGVPAGTGAGRTTVPGVWIRTRGRTRRTSSAAGGLASGALIRGAWPGCARTSASPPGRTRG